ncbi:hypothetical protein FJTKL_07159 [Diaporthe vaccinii]|uniref:Uncharacterized protein n=1 Tax=Diaporthe vaccinii TaxID=105482 RepID=A0ABR4EVC1_9PEZI
MIGDMLSPRGLKASIAGAEGSSARVETMPESRRWVRRMRCWRCRTNASVLPEIMKSYEALMLASDGNDIAVVYINVRA